MSPRHWAGTCRAQTQGIYGSADIKRTTVGELRILWSRAPWTLRVYIAATELLALWAVVFHRTTWGEVASVLFLAVSYFLVKRVRWLWFVMIGGSVLYLVAFLVAARPVGVAANLVPLVLLLAPPTRRHFTSDGVAAVHEA